MTGEFSNNETQEIKPSVSENFKEIKPEIQMTDQEVKNYWESEFQNADVNYKEDTTEKANHNDAGSELNERIDIPDDKQGNNREIREKDVVENDSSPGEISDLLRDSKGIEKIFENYPEKQEVWKKELDSLNVLNDPDASPVEMISAQSKLSKLKGDLLETAVKDVLKAKGFDVQETQQMVKGELGDTKPDVVATNNTDHPIEALGRIINPGDVLSAECKCGASGYMKEQIENHIPKQLAGQEGSRTLIATSDINKVSDLAENTCKQYDAKLVSLDVSVADVEKAIKGMA